MNKQFLTTPRIIQGQSLMRSLSEREKQALHPEFFQLEEPYFTVVLLHDHYRWSYAKIAYRLQRRVGTVKAQIYRGRKKLALCFPMTEALI